MCNIMQVLTQMMFYDGPLVTTTSNVNLKFIKFTDL